MESEGPKVWSDIKVTDVTFFFSSRFFVLLLIPNSGEEETETVDQGQLPICSNKLTGTDYLLLNFVC